MMRFADSPRSVLAVGLFAVFALGASAGHDDADNGGTPVGAVQHYRSPARLAVSPDGLTIYAADETARCVTILDAVKRVKRSDIELNGRPHGLALSPDGRTLYVAEFGGGILLIIGLATRFAALSVTATMAVAVFKVHWGAFLLPNGMEYALTLGIVALGLIFTGPGRLALDYFFRRRPAETPPPRKK